jgi:hypothetical protein
MRSTGSVHQRTSPDPTCQIAAKTQITVNHNVQLGSSTCKEHTSSFGLTGSVLAVAAGPCPYPNENWR